MYRLENWSVSTDNPYYPPEAGRQYLAGNVYGHPRFEDGHRILTSKPVKADGRLITTFSGSVYQLGKVSDDYLAWLTEHGFKFDEKNPIKFKGEDDLTNAEKL